MTASLKNFLNMKNVEKFYMGKIYPIVICFLVLFGNLTGLDYYTIFILAFIGVGALFTMTSARPLITVMCSFVYQVSLEHSFVKISDQGIGASDFYFSSWRLPVSILLAILIVASFITFIIRCDIPRHFNPKGTPIFIPTALFSVALVLNGVFSSSWSVKDLFLGSVHAILFMFLFAIFYHGFKDEKTDELMKYVAYVAMLIAAVLVVEMAHLYLTSDEIFKDGAIVKDRVYLGWGIWNLVGVNITLLIPLVFFGAMNNKYPWLYFSVATLAYVAAVFTMSRNALIFATLSYGACAIIGCFKGKNRKGFRIITVAGASAVILGIIVLFPKIKAMLGDYFSRGFDNNGRFGLWMEGFDNFLSAPVFGKGFYGYGDYSLAHGPLPKMAHNTIFELLSATGAVGLITYGYYRAKSLVPVFKNPTLVKTMAAMSIFVILGGSLLDNFVFNFYPMFYYAFLLALIFRASDEEGSPYKEISLCRCLKKKK